MQLPSQSEVNAIARHVASFAGGIIVAFGLGTKINPDTVTALINATGDLVNDTITILGIITPVVSAWYASRSAKPLNQAQAVQQAASSGTLPPAAQIAVLNAAAAVPGTRKVINPNFAPDPATSIKVVAQ